VQYELCLFTALAFVCSDSRVFDCHLAMTASEVLILVACISVFVCNFACNFLVLLISTTTGKQLPLSSGNILNGLAVILRSRAYVRSPINFSFYSLAVNLYIFIVFFSAYRILVFI